MLGDARQTKRRVTLLLALLVYLFGATMISIFAFYVPYRDVLRCLITGVGLLLALNQWYSCAFSPRNVLLLLLPLLVLTLISTATYYLFSSQTRTALPYAVLQLSDSVMWIAVFCWSYDIGHRGDNAIARASWVSYAAALFFLLFLGVKQYSDGQGIPLISTTYYALFLLPFVLMQRRRIVKWGLVLLIFATVLLSVKRTGFLAITIAMLAYFLVELARTDSRHRGRLRTVCLGLVLLAVGYVFFQNYTTANDLPIWDRLLAIEEDGGSGRTEIWGHTWDMIRGSEPLFLVFGHGFNTVAQDSALGLSAHCDILEVLYDYGIVGTLLYGCFCVRIATYYRTVKRRRPELAGSYAVSLVLFVCLSLVSHLIIYPTYFLFLCVFWGLVIGELDRDSRIRRIVG